MNEERDELRPWRKRRVIFAVLGAALLAGLALALLRPAVSEFDPAARLVGTDEAPLPRVEPEQAGFAPDELELAARYGERFGAMALVVARNGHVVYESYAPTFDRDSLIDARAFAPELGRMALRAARDDRLPVEPMEAIRDDAGSVAQLASAIEAAAGMPYAAYVSQNIWAPLGATDAYLWRERSGDDVHAACCLFARTEDLVRVGELIVNEGVYRGEQIVSDSPGPVPERIADDHGLRLWLVPEQRIVILRTGSEPEAGSDWDEERIPALIAGAAANRASLQGSREMADPAMFAPH